MILKSIEEEAADCRQAFVGIEVGAIVIHCHHEFLLEELTEPAEARISYILFNKPYEEQALRLRLFRPLNPKLITPELSKALEEWYKALEECSNAQAEYAAVWEEYAAVWADAKWNKAQAEYAKARAEWDKTVMEWDNTYEHYQLCQAGCPWDGSTIFPASKKE